MSKSKTKELEQIKQAHGDLRASEVVEQDAAMREAIRAAQAVENKVQKALMHLVLHKPFFGALVLRLKVEEDRRGHPTLWTDARVLRYNSEHVAALSFDHLVASLAKCVAHCALRHPFRRGSRSPQLWAKATSQVALDLLMKDGEFSFHPSAWDDVDQRFEGMSAEQVYAVLESEQPPQPKPEEQPQQSESPSPSSPKQQEKEQQGSGGSSSEGEQQGKEQQSSSASDQSPQSSEQNPKNASDTDKKSADERNSQSKGDASSDQQQGPQKDPSPDNDGSGQPPESQPPGSEQQQRDPSLEQSPGNPMGDALDAGTSGRGDEEQPESEDPQMDESCQAPMSEQEMREGEEDWECAASAAAVQAEVAGNLAAEALRKVRESFLPVVPYGEYMRMFVASLSKDDQSWSRPNRRTAASGPYLPSLRTEAAGVLVIGIDTSGSVGQRMLERFQAELQGIVAELKPERVHVAYCDAHVHAVQVIERWEPVEFDPAKLIGGGGTRFGPVFEAAHELMLSGERVAGVIYLTDLIGKFPADEPPYPVLWVQTGSSQRKAPFGEVCWMGNQ